MGLKAHASTESVFSVFSGPEAPRSTFTPRAIASADATKTS